MNPRFAVPAGALGADSSPLPLPRLWFRGRGDILLDAATGDPAVPPDSWAADALPAAEDHFVMRPQGIPVARLPADAPVAAPPPDCLWGTYRRLLGSGSPWGPAAGRALGLLNWRRRTRYCGRCGAPMAEHPAEIARVCASCGEMAWPDVSPAVIVRVEKDGKILLARHAYRDRDIYACVAGHVDTGETAEECVRREVREETGLEIDSVRYVGSQHWPFPNQLMLAFTARWASGDIRVQPEELLEAAWFSPSALPPTPPPGSVAHKLIHGLF